MAGRSIFLQLPVELGGVRFGPFPGTVALGSDGKRCGVVLDPSMGVFPIHVTIAQGADGAFTVVPATRECKVFLMPNAQPHVWPVTGPVQAHAGDQVIVGTPSGPRFQLLSDQPVARAPTATDAVRTARQTGGEQGFVQGMSSYIDGVFRPAGGGIGGEIQRRVVANALSKLGPLRSFYVFWTRLRSGNLFSPYVVVGLVFAVIGLVGTGSLSCSGLLYVLIDVLGLRR